MASGSKRGRLGIGVLIGAIGYGFVALPLAFVADRIVYAGRGSF
ncbi:MAG: hypothetical protein JWP02_2655 [Acidimicrobiales bacterium]|nr:hypothetical protein [Acidimicrobiales bacterium]